MLIVTEIAATPSGRRRRVLGLLGRLLVLALLAGVGLAAWHRPIRLALLFDILLAPMPILLHAAGYVATRLPLDGAIGSALANSVVTLAYGLYVLALLAIAYAVLVLVTPRKPLVLYLRKFGLSSANSAISTAVRRGLGSRYRVVTLDDSRFLPIGVEASVRHSFRLALPLVVLAGLGIVTAMILYGLGLWGTHTSSLSGIGGLGIAIAALGLLILTELLVPFSGFVLLFALIVQHFRRVRRHSRTTIANAANLSRLKERWYLLGSRAVSPGFMAPRAAVVTTDDAIWQPTVQAGVAAASAVVLDLSRPTENVLWEIEQILIPPAPPVAFIGEAEALKAWIDVPPADRSPVVDRFHSLLQDRTILAYCMQTGADLAVFSRSLDNHLGNLTAGAPSAMPLDGPSPLLAAFKRRMKAMIPLWIGVAICFWTVANLLFAGLKALSA